MLLLRQLFFVYNQKYFDSIKNQFIFLDLYKKYSYFCN